MRGDHVDCRSNSVALLVLRTNELDFLEGNRVPNLSLRDQSTRGGIDDPSISDRNERGRSKLVDDRGTFSRIESAWVSFRS